MEIHAILVTIWKPLCICTKKTLIFDQKNLRIFLPHHRFAMVASRRTKLSGEEAPSIYYVFHSQIETQEAFYMGNIIYFCIMVMHHKYFF